MIQYINKEDVVAKIYALQEATMDKNHNFLSSYHEGIFDALSMIENFLDTIEVKEEILDKEGKTNLMQKCVHKAYKRGYDMGVLQTTNKMNHDAKDVDLEKEINEHWDDWAKEDGFHSIDFAKHFFELGLEAQKAG